jgi:hypothetical protein
MEKRQTKSNDYIAGGLAGVTEVLLTHPIDVIKTHLQNKDKLYFNFKTLTKGIGMRLVGIVPMRFTFWLTQDITQNAYTIENKLLKNLSCGITAGFFQTFVDHPIEMVRINSLYSQKNSFMTALDLYKNKQLFKCFGYTMSRNLGFGGVYLTSRHLIEQELNVSNVFASSAFAGLTASVLTQPLDYFKTHRQSLTHATVKQSLLVEFQTTIKQNPLLMWTGGGMRALICFVNMGIGFTFYEYFKDIKFLDGTI